MTAELKYWDNTIQYEPTTGTYQVERIYAIDSVPETAIGEAYGTIPISITITHQHFLDASSTITLYAVKRDVQRQGPTSSLMTVIFEGHVLGVIQEGCSFDFGTKAENRKFDLDNKEIGAQNEGTNRHVPLIRIKILQNLEDISEFQGKWDKIEALIGTTNEAEWLDPIILIYWEEGLWLYLGAEVTTNRDRSYTLQHIFEYDVNEHLYQYYVASITTETVGGLPIPIYQPQGDLRERRLYNVAGTQVTTKFDDLFN